MKQYKVGDTIYIKGTIGWIADHQDKVARAWLDGYEVEK